MFYWAFLACRCLPEYHPEGLSYTSWCFPFPFFHLLKNLRKLWGNDIRWLDKCCLQHFFYSVLAFNRSGERKVTLGAAPSRRCGFCDRRCDHKPNNYGVCFGVFFFFSETWASKRCIIHLVMYWGQPQAFPPPVHLFIQLEKPFLALKSNKMKSFFFCVCLQTWTGYQKYSSRGEQRVCEGPGPHQALIGSLSPAIWRGWDEDEGQHVWPWPQLPSSADTPSAGKHISSLMLLRQQSLNHCHKFILKKTLFI